ncbi:MAG: AraC family transcriptional regulator [Verrucomicrobiota bacterium]
MPKTRRTGIAEGFPNERLLVVPGPRLKEAERMPVLKDLRVSHMGQFAEARNHRVVRNEGVKEHVLIYCLAGRGGGNAAGKTFSLGAGDLVVLPPGKPHRYFADVDAPWTILWFHFSGQRAGDYVRAMEMPGITLHVPRMDVIGSAFEETYRDALDGFSDAGMLGMATGFMRIVGLFRRHSRARGTRARHAEDSIVAVIAILQLRLGEPWTVARMAGLAGMSAAHFSERFKRQIGEAPMRYVIHQRMQRAAALLQKGDATISSVAAETGYDDSYYFSRLFRATFGLSPRMYRDRLMRGSP